MNEPDDQENPKPPSIPFRLSDYSPNTNMIMGALLSGGDPLKMAEIIVEAQDKAAEKS